MNRVGHLTIGVLGVIVVIGIVTGFTFNMESDILAYVLVASAIGSILPDTIEPARHWSHRKAWHSKRAFDLTGKVSGIAFLIALVPTFFIEVSLLYIVFALPFGYFLHLLTDSGSYVGLPTETGKWQPLGRQWYGGKPDR